jgi:hypothetical protein
MKDAAAQRCVRDRFAEPSPESHQVHDRAGRIVDAHVFPRHRFEGGQPHLEAEYLRWRATDHRRVCMFRDRDLRRGRHLVRQVVHLCRGDAAGERCDTANASGYDAGGASARRNTPRVSFMRFP